MSASQLGTIQLVMRSPGDDQSTPIAQARPSDLFGTTSAKSHREKETTEPTNLGDQAKDLVDFLNATKKNTKTPAVEPKPATAPTTWTMRMLKPGAVDDIQFEKTADTAATPVGWKVTGSTAPGSNAGNAGSPPAKSEPAVVTAPSIEPPAPPKAPVKKTKGAGD